MVRRGQEGPMMYLPLVGLMTHRGQEGQTVYLELAGLALRRDQERPMELAGLIVRQGW
jgi:hypothetical protein